MLSLLLLLSWLVLSVMTALFFITNSLLFLPSVCATIMLTHYITKDTMNVVQGVGPLYWITRDVVPPNTPQVGWGFMRETGYPWRSGKGLQINLGTHTFQIGLCRRAKVQSTTDGILHALQGRMMAETPKEIRKWR